MRDRLLALSILLLGIAFLARAESNEGTQCTNQELTFIVDIQGAFANLYEGRKTWTTGADQQESAALLVAYVDSVLEWRDTHLDNFPICDEAFEMAWALSEIANGSIAVAALFLNEAETDSLYFDQQFDAQNRRNAAIFRARSQLEQEQRERISALGARRFPDCSLRDYENTANALAGLGELLILAQDIDDMEGLDAYAIEHAAWRDHFRANAPNCESFRRLSLTLLHMSYDMFNIVALREDGVVPSDNPYSGPLLEDMQYLLDFEDSFHEKWAQERERHGDLQPQVADSRRCPDDVYEENRELLLRYLTQGELAITSLAELVDFSQAQVDWRARNIVELPHCVEMLKIQTLLIHFNSDFVVRAGLELAGVPAESNPHLQLPSDQERATTPSLLDNSPLAGFTLSRACTDSEIQETVHEHTGDYTVLLNMLRYASAIDKYIEYLDAQIAWRDDMWRRLPLCAEVIELGLLMQKVLSGYASFLALHYAGLPQEDNPYWPQIQADRLALQELTLMLLQDEQSDDLTTEQLAALPACGNSEWQAIADVLVEYQGELDGGPHLTLNRLIMYNYETHILREDRLPQLPLCSAGIGTRIFLTQLINDFVARGALEFVSVSDERNPYLRLPSDRERMEAAALAILNVNRDRQPTGYASELPACTEPQVERILEVQDSYHDQLGAAAFSDPVREIYDFTDTYLEWRANELPALPACEEAVQFGFALNEFTSDSAAYYALLAAGAQDNKIAQTISLRSVRSQLIQILTQLELQQSAAKSK